MTTYRSPDQQQRLDRITSIATKLVTGQVADGTLDPKDQVAMERASKQAVRDAAEVYDAAMDYVFK